MNYQIIKDKDLLLNFIEWLPETLPNEQYYVSLLSRNKYSTNGNILGSDKNQLKRFTSQKKYLYRKLKQLECEFGSYTSDNIAISQESLVVYISVNPRDLVLATKQSTKKFLDLLLNNNHGYNPHAVVLSEIQKACSRKIYIDFDFDNINVEETIEQIKKVINFDCVSILRTRGGIHCLIKTKDINPKFNNTWYKDITSIEGCDIKGDNLIPIPGCTQGNFIPHFYI